MEREFAMFPPVLDLPAPRETRRRWREMECSAGAAPSGGFNVPKSTCMVLYRVRSASKIQSLSKLALTGIVCHLCRSLRSSLWRHGLPQEKACLKRLPMRYLRCRCRCRCPCPAVPEASSPRAPESPNLSGLKQYALWLRLSSALYCETANRLREPCHPAMGHYHSYSPGLRCAELQRGRRRSEHSSDWVWCKVWLHRRNAVLGHHFLPVA